MKLPKETKRYCPTCRKHTTHKIDTAKQRSRGSARPLSWGSQSRVEARGVNTGNLGRRSKPPLKSWKRKTKVTRRITVTYKCAECGKMHGIKKAIRTGRVEVGEKVAK